MFSTLRILITKLSLQAGIFRACMYIDLLTHSFSISTSRPFFATAPYLTNPHFFAGLILRLRQSMYECYVLFILLSLWLAWFLPRICKCHISCLLAWIVFSLSFWASQAANRSATLSDHRHSTKSKTKAYIRTNTTSPAIINQVSDNQWIQLTDWCQMCLLTRCRWRYQTCVEGTGGWSELRELQDRCESCLEKSYKLNSWGCAVWP